MWFNEVAIVDSVCFNRQKFVGREFLALKQYGVRKVLFKRHQNTDIILSKWQPPTELGAVTFLERRSIYSRMRC